MNIHTFTLPINAIKAIRNFSASNDIRYCLNSIAIQNGCIRATDGHILGSYEVDGLRKDIPEIIIPSSAIDTIIKTIGKKTDYEVACEYDAENKILTMKLHSGISFKVVPENAKYPDCDRVMVPHLKIGATVGFTQLNTHYLMKFENAAKELRKVKRNESAIVVIPSIDYNSSTRVKIIGQPNFEGVIMPVRLNKEALESTGLPVPSFIVN